MSNFYRSTRGKIALERSKVERAQFRERYDPLSPVSQRRKVIEEYSSRCRPDGINRQLYDRSRRKSVSQREKRAIDSDREWVKENKDSLRKNFRYRD